MKFRFFLEQRELAIAFKNKLQDVPQDPVHHPEGDVLTHTRLVRKAIPKAIQELQNARNGELAGPLMHINFELSEKEMQIITLAAWIHDIGKYSATTIDKQPWKLGGTGRIQAIGHEDKEHFIPQLKDLEKFAPENTKQLYYENSELINWLVEHHMDFTSGSGFSKKFVAENFTNGQVNPSTQMKLLLILMWSDKMGRIPADTIKDALKKNITGLVSSAKKSITRSDNIAKQNSPFSGTPEEFSQMLKSRNTSLNQRVMALQNKFPEMDSEMIRKLAENNQNEPTVMKAQINIPQDCYVVAKALTDGFAGTEVYVVGGSVRDYLFGKQPKDFDLTCNLSEKQIVERLQNSGLNVHEKNSDTFGVVFVSVFEGQEPVEVAPFRADIGIADGRRPDSVQFGVGMDQDALRRDFTMNSLYYDFGFGRYGENTIVDFNPNGQGIQDIKNGVVRPVGNPADRFKEDRFRILRLIRFFSRYNAGDILQFIDKPTRNAINRYGNLRTSVEGLAPISDERIQSEFMAGFLQSQNTAEYLKNYIRLNLLSVVFPNLKIDVNGIDKLSNMKNIRVALAWLLRMNRNVGTVLNQLKYPNSISEPVQFLIDAMNVGNDNVFTMVRHRDKNAELSPILKQDMLVLAKISQDPKVIQALQHFSSYDMPVANGRDLQAQGYSGKDIGIEQKRRATDHYAQSFKTFLNNQPQDTPLV